MAISSKFLGDGESVVLTTRTHPKALIWPVIALLLILALGAWLAQLAGDASGGIVAILVWVLTLAAVVWFSVRPFITWLTTSYTFTDRRFIKRSGFVAKVGRTIPLNRISGVDFEMGVIDRLFGCGTLVVSDASTNGRVELHDIPRVEQAQLQVSDVLNGLVGRPGEDRLDDGA